MNAAFILLIIWLSVIGTLLFTPNSYNNGLILMLTTSLSILIIIDEEYS